MNHHRPLALKAPDPADLVAAISLVLGFTPTESVVVLLTWSDPDLRGRAPQLMRMDLADAAQLSDQLAALTQGYGSAEVAVVAFGADLVGPEAETAGVRTVMALGPDIHPVAAVQMVAATDGRTAWCACQDRVCRQRRWPIDVESHRFTAEGALAGHSVRPLAQVEADLRAGIATTWPVVDKVAVAETIDFTGTGHPRSWIEQAFVLADRREPVCTRVDAAHLVAASNSMVVRDVIWAHITRANAADALALWSWVARHTEPRLAVAALALVASSAWQLGNGYLARIACEQAIAINPEHGMSRLVGVAVAGGIDPARWTPPCEDELDAQIASLWG